MSEAFVGGGGTQNNRYQNTLKGTASVPINKFDFVDVSGSTITKNYQYDSKTSVNYGFTFNARHACAVGNDRVVLNTNNLIKVVSPTGELSSVTCASLGLPSIASNVDYFFVSLSDTTFAIVYCAAKNPIVIYMMRLTGNSVSRISIVSTGVSLGLSTDIVNSNLTVVTYVSSLNAICCATQMNNSSDSNVYLNGAVSILNADKDAVVSTTDAGRTSLIVSGYGEVKDLVGFDDMGRLFGSYSGYSSSSIYFKKISTSGWTSGTLTASQNELPSSCYENQIGWYVKPGVYLYSVNAGTNEYATKMSAKITGSSYASPIAQTQAGTGTSKTKISMDVSQYSGNEGSIIVSLGSILYRVYPEATSPSAMFVALTMGYGTGVTTSFIGKMVPFKDGKTFITTTGYGVYLDGTRLASSFPTNYSTGGVATKSAEIGDTLTVVRNGLIFDADVLKDFELKSPVQSVCSGKAPINEVIAVFNSAI